MKSVALLLLVVCVSPCCFTNTKCRVAGSVQPNVVENKGEVNFTCQVALDSATVRKLNQVLNEVLSNT